LKSTPPVLAAEGDAQLVHHERAAVGDGDAAADAGRAEVLAPLEHLEQHPLGLLVELEEPDQLLEDVVLGRPSSSSLTASSAKNSRSSIVGNGRKPRHPPLGRQAIVNIVKRHVASTPS
jgi:hypothetical protein